jgi:heme-degrading monooxygenase HmoA
MVKFVELDKKVKLAQQMEEDIGPVILINTFHVKPEDTDQLIEAWAADAAFFKQQAGYISTQLHRGIEEVVRLSITQFGNLQNITKMHLTRCHQMYSQSY